MKNKERLILTDVDGVLLRWSAGFDVFMADKGYVRIPDTEQHYNLSYRFNIDSWQEVSNLAREFNESPMMKFLDPLDGAVENVAKLVDQGFRFTAITSMSSAPHAKEHRMENLHSLFGEVFDDLICLDFGGGKRHILEQWANSELFWLEDHFNNATDGHELGLSPILFDDPTNRHLLTDLFPRTSGETPWDDAYKIIMDDYEKAI